LSRELEDYQPVVIDNVKETVTFQYGKYTIQVSDLNQGYPFKPPCVSIDGKILAYTPSFFPPRLITDYAKKYDCPCCVSITCPDNWSPAFRITDILKEFLVFTEKLKTFQKLKMFAGVDLPDDMIFEINSFF
jgi:ubiquitin-protein ligase